AGHPHTGSVRWTAQTSVCASSPAVRSETASSPAASPTAGFSAPATGYMPPLPAEDFLCPDSWRRSSRVDFLFPLYREKSLHTSKNHLPKVRNSRWKTAAFPAEYSPKISSSVEITPVLSDV